MMEASPTPSIAAAPSSIESGALPIHPEDRFIGTYQCGQGRTDMAITLEDVIRRDGGETYDVTAFFEFHFAGDLINGYPPAAGAARLRGVYFPRRQSLRLEGDTWIERPADYVFVTFAGSLDPSGSTFAGRVEGPRCTSFSASRVTLPAQ